MTALSKGNDSNPILLALVPNWLGDAAMCTPALRALSRRFPAYRFEVIGRAAPCALLEGLPWIHAFHVIEREMPLRALLAFGKSFRSEKPAVAVAFPHSFRAALLAWRTGAKRRLGYARNGRAMLLTHAPQPCREEGRIAPVYMALEYLELVAALGCDPDGRGLELRADPEDLEDVRARVGEGGPLVAVAPGAAFGPSKRWPPPPRPPPPERFAAVCDALGETCGARCMLLTGPGEEATRAAVLAAARRPPIEIPNGPRGGIATLKAAIACADLLIGNDSGPRHIAIAFGKPVVCIMGPTSPRYTDSPWEKGEILRAEVDCAPCQQPECPADHVCMTAIAAGQVIEAARRWLE